MLLMSIILRYELWCVSFVYLNKFDIFFSLFEWPISNKVCNFKKEKPV